MSENSRPMALPPFPSEYRASGLLLHVTSLPSPYGTGDVGGGPTEASVKLLEAIIEKKEASLPQSPEGVLSFAGSKLLCCDGDGLRGAVALRVVSLGLDGVRSFLSGHLPRVAVRCRRNSAK